MTQEMFPTGDLEQATPPESRQQHASSKREEQEFVDRVMYWLTAPYITWPGYEDIYRSNGNKDRALVQRLACHEEIHREKACTEFEAMLYISTATLVAPPSHAWYTIYMYLFNRCMPEQAEANGLDGIKKLNGSDAEDLMRLRQWIYKKQVLHLKEKTTSAAPRELRRMEKEVEVERPRLF
ncbi:MAG: hypothetical protein HY531_02740 [Chloroflexi bacterium]|nr:hypothetical protein [Chloroflexota bacterium]